MVSGRAVAFHLGWYLLGGSAITVLLLATLLLVAAMLLATFVLLVAVAIGTVALALVWRLRR